MLRFKGTELRLVIAEAIANDCQIVLAKDDGVYFLAEQGEGLPEGRRKLIAYAVGCNPGVDAFDDWWNLARAELGGDDFAEYFDPKAEAFEQVLSSGDDLELSATPTHITLQPIKPARPTR
nr:DUF3085 domain-containing protein [Luteimonas sp. XNQY3]